MLCCFRVGLTHGACTVQTQYGASQAYKRLCCIVLSRHLDLLQKFVLDHSAETMQAVPTMLELVPRGVNKGSGMRKLLADLELPAEVGVPATHRAAAAMDRQQQDSDDDHLTCADGHSRPAA